MEKPGGGQEAEQRPEGRAAGAQVAGSPGRSRERGEKGFQVSLWWQAPFSVVSLVALITREHATLCAHFTISLPALECKLLRAEVCVSFLH